VCDIQKREKKERKWVFCQGPGKDRVDIGKIHLLAILLSQGRDTGTGFEIAFLYALLQV